MIGIFGANGFIGSNLARSLAADGQQFTAVARHFDPWWSQDDARLIRGDLSDQEVMAAALEGVDVVVQLMGSSTPAQGNSRSTEHIENDVIPHVDFLNLCVERGVRRFVFASSGGSVYGPVSGDRPTDEEWPTLPISSHGVTKLTVERFVTLHGHLDGLEFVILRIANPYGPGQVFRNGQGLIPAMMDRYRMGKPVTIFGDGSAARDYVYIDDVVLAFRKASEMPAARSLTLNVGSGIRRSVLEVVRSIEEVAGIRFNIDFQPPRQTDVPTIALDISQIERQLGWKPQMGFLEGLERTLRHSSR